MSLSFSLLVAAALFFRQTPTPAEPAFLSGEVLDKFDGERILLSFGSEQGVRKGLRGTIIRLKFPDGIPFALKSVGTQEVRSARVSPSPSALQWVVEFVDVAAKHSVAKRVVDERMSPWDFRFPEHDPIVWSKELPWEARERRDRQMKEMSKRLAEPIEYSYPLPRSSWYGGAIIDLTRPAEIRVPRK